MKYLLIIFLSMIYLGSTAHAKVYDFKTLYQNLGYVSHPKYFGANDQEAMSLDSYIDKEDSFYSEINGYLRFYPGAYDWVGTGPAAAKEEVKDIDAIFDRVPELPQDLTLFRGITLGWRKNQSYNIGDEFVEKAYTSTSTNYSVVTHFAHGLDDKDKKNEKGAVFTLYFAKPHQKGILINQGEDEVILKRGRHFRIMDRVLGQNEDHYLVQICDPIRCDEKVNQPEILINWSHQKNLK